MVQMKSMKWRNAYLLFYERKMMDDVVDEDDEEIKKGLASQSSDLAGAQDVVMQN
eukprot:CAMPEP_0202977726 /NCGR_PEP_ID=MMETSP1396-20130829/84419_1 /ASSEMBLY_ACC=CAM_ASM_000872 /TAXON_ID= /ORGANISM="Pseudokeronopsis sp., Strain Brazil" /LENGTH=54 /DNA_ID=CAMNT_0049716525 /DNA_START=4476 /DNA_END=4640 /DNA_ORIENTATION=-